MAGIVLSFGSDTEHDFNKIRHNYEALKCLKESCHYSGDTCNIVKYGRQNDEDDNNYFDSTRIILCVVGTLLYKKYGIPESVKQLGQDIHNGRTIANLIDDIDGNYFLILFLKKDSKIICITDAGGTISTYIIKNGSNYFVSTSMLALAQYFPVTVNSSAVMAFLRTGVFLEDSTYFNEIEVLEPGTIFTYTKDVSSLEKIGYWHVPNNIDNNITFENAVKKLQEALIAIVEKVPANDSLYDFTGGYDSRFVTALAYSKQKELNAFYFGTSGSREEKIVRNNCSDLNISYNNYPLPRDWSNVFFDYVLESLRLSDGMINAFDYAPVLWIQRKKKEKFKYSMLGLFGEIYRNRIAVQEFWSEGKNQPANIARYITFQNLEGSFSSEIFSKKVRPKIENMAEYLLEVYSKTNERIEKNSPNTLQLDNIYFSHRMRKWGGRFLTTSNQILQPICPLWFRKPLSISFSLPPSMKARAKIIKAIVKIVSPEFTSLKTISGSPSFTSPNIKNCILFLPGMIYHLLKAFRKFVGIIFKKSIWGKLSIPVYDRDQWFKTALSDLRCKNILDYNKMLSSEYYDEEHFKKFIDEAKKTDFKFFNQMGLIATVEMTLRFANLKENHFR